MRAIVPTHLILLEFIILIMFCETQKKKKKKKRNLIIMQFPPASNYFLLLRFKYSPQHLVPKSPQIMLFLQ